MPSIAPALPAAGPSPLRRLFISYSHENLSEYAKDFHRYLIGMLRGRPEVGYTEADIFFDLNRLKAGEDWDETIQLELERSGALIFLVSDHSLASSFCLEREVRTALKRGIPVFPVVLCECPWFHQPLPDDQQRRRLGSLGAVPKDDQRFRLVPVKNWPDRNMAWQRVVEQIADALVGAAPMPEAMPPEPVQSVRPKAPKLLPYFCNQTLVAAKFRGELGQWKRSALLVVVKGERADRLPRFWARLRQKNLADFAKTGRQSLLLEERPLSWPPARDELSLRSRGDLERDLWIALSNSLTGDDRAISNAAQLAGHLAGLKGVLPLMATLPKEPAAALQASLGTLLDLFEHSPAETALDRLAIALVLEDDEPGEKVQLTQSLRSNSRTHIIELDRLNELDSDEVINWHRENSVSKYTALDEFELAEEIFASTPRIRFAQFEKDLKRLQIIP